MSVYQDLTKSLRMMYMLQHMVMSHPIKILLEKRHGPDRRVKKRCSPLKNKKEKSCPLKIIIVAFYLFG